MHAHQLIIMECYTHEILRHAIFFTIYVERIRRKDPRYTANQHNTILKLSKDGDEISDTTHSFMCVFF